ncbi:MAG: aspartate/tyrosine/aromatic aminotransferase [Simkaniaceae bacterium]|nr:aspartate/tyrosine/aromatic aminotransferase [Simkaniaceae bacterium]
MSFFQKVPLSPPDPIFGINAAFHADPRERKVNLTIGIYQDQRGKTNTLECIKKVEEKFPLCEANKGYFGMGGDGEYCLETGKLVFGPLWDPQRIFVAATVGGTGALRIGFEFLSGFTSRQGYVSTPTWVNHIPIMEKVGFTVHPYPYFKENGVDFSSMLATLEKGVEGSVVLLHTSCHNPTGCDLTKEQWKELSLLMKSKKLIPFFDFAYQGFYLSNDEDAFPVRQFYQDGHEMLVATSYSKSMGLYGERVGSLMIVSEKLQEVSTTVCAQIRVNYSNPPRHGELLAKMVLQNQELRGMWLLELEGMRQRILSMRHLLHTKLSQEVQERNWDFLLKQNGMFSLSGLSTEEVAKIVHEQGIYMTKAGRINLCGLNEENVDVVAEAFKKVCTNHSV